MAPTALVLLLALAFPAFAMAQVNGSRTPALRGSNFTADLELFVASNDPCWIHQGCSSAGYSNEGSMGPGWYCSDGMYVDANTAFDSCAVHRSCRGVGYEGGKWVCSDGNHGGVIPGITDSCYIHQGCSAAGYSGDNKASLGNGWYCLDGQYVDANSKFDNCAIHKQCSCGVEYKLVAWVCEC
ncbi:unnamed protein product [Polarella glacialis]|uniref:Uncharacterized protein n=1 Tax=Polarella glacialis TaxID=89957 RepID=A0A813HCL6_POLGL|nr:unnamed protein product [Polarella glacialis]CAE8635290.1 unnamed protein product [Polarella glacialis]|eukprot:CAMPEP_0115094916 /NCGR_PEP_ID=MMETSP0227-20121206/28677_1 /TAXON_ID=89957 /ORGANISM="Polarella glacialis, Strain CCMP 1383" /LENGTH=182 /DNA_ID=CAMNT_0002488079 /DNA_START=70 /DNA_END=618 /DNA_ORIENTATION=-